MPAFEIWVEGYRCTGEHGTATKRTVEPIIAESFDDAVRIFIDQVEAPENRQFWRCHADGRWSMWACSAYPDEASALRFMG